MERIPKEQLERENKFILDVCSGPKMFWRNKKQPNTIFMDIRKREKGFNNHRPNREINPDVIGDFRDLPFEDNSFNIVVMDPPHLFGKSENCNMTKDYGWLNKETWKDDIKKGFDECRRVLKPHGTLIFKWNEACVKKKEIFEVLEEEGLFGHQVGSKIPTFWFTFTKINCEVNQK